MEIYNYKRELFTISAF